MMVNTTEDIIECSSIFIKNYFTEQQFVTKTCQAYTICIHYLWARTKTRAC